MVWILINYNERFEHIDIDLNEDVATFRFQLYSLFDVEPDQQCITGLHANNGRGVLNDNDDMSKMNIKPNQIVTLTHINTTTCENNQEEELPLDIVLSIPWQSTCSRVMFGATSKIRQPGAQTSSGARLCFCCATTCSQGKMLETLTTNLPFACQCSSANTMCLFQGQVDAGDEHLVDPVRRQLLKVIGNLADESVQQVRAEASRKFQERVESHAQSVYDFEDPINQAFARHVIPVDILKQRADDNPNPLPGNDELLRQLLHWFKNEFFSWVNTIPCNKCNGQTESAGASSPTIEEQQFRAGIIELYKCKSCNAISRFPRYNHSGKLLETKRGRCGEWAQAFTLCCRALGYDARYVVDWTDHVWTEVYSDETMKWVHCDPCEDSYDAPLLYESGWGKKLNYAIAFSVDEIRDVTRRYCKDYNETMERRDIVKEDWLEQFLRSLSDKRRLSSNRREIVEARWRIEHNQLLGIVHQDDAIQSLPGRTTGSVAWREARGELGILRSANAASPSSSTIISGNLHSLIVALYSQISIGCGRDSCSNMYCKSSANKQHLPSTKSEILKLSITLARTSGSAALCTKLDDAPT